MKTLNQIVQRSLDQGWDMFGLPEKYQTVKYKVHVDGTVGFRCGWVDKVNVQRYICKVYSLSDIIFNYDFMKALVGEELVCATCGTPVPERGITCAFCNRYITVSEHTNLAYEFHLSLVVNQKTNDARIAYLFDQIKGE